jgi:hypothetical protein
MGLTLLLLRAGISNEGHRKTEWQNRIFEVRRSSAARMCSGPLADDALMIVAKLPAATGREEIRLWQGRLLRPRRERPRRYARNPRD